MNTVKIFVGAKNTLRLSDIFNSRIFARGCQRKYWEFRGLVSKLKKLNTVILSSAGLKITFVSVIRNGSVTIQNNPRMCFLATKVDWNEILYDSSRQKVETTNSHKACWKNGELIASCHESCKDKCWGKGDNDCQKS